MQREQVAGPPPLARYVSIGLYMPVLGLLAAGFLLTAVGGWMHLLRSQLSEQASWGPFHPSKLFQISCCSVEGGGKEQRVPAVFPAKLGKVPCLISTLT